MDSAVYRFGQYALDADRRCLSHEGQRVDVEPQALDLLCHLVEHRGRVVPETELRERMGHGQAVSEAALATSLRAARIAIGDSDTRQQVIRAVSPHGYRFVAQTTVASPLPVATATAPGIPAGAEADHEDIRFCRSADGTRIAYARSGEGPPLVKTANWLTHLDLDRTNPMWAHWFDGLTRGRQLIRYDERGCGLPRPGARRGPVRRPAGAGAEPCPARNHRSDTCPPSPLQRTTHACVCTHERVSGTPPYSRPRTHGPHRRQDAY